MKPSHVILYHYLVPFLEPVRVRGRRLTERQGLVFALLDAAGERVAYGEVAPLPGLHRETLEQAEAQLTEVLSRRIIGGDTAVSCLLPEGLFPSVRTGIEMALLNGEALGSGRFPSCSLDARPAGRGVPLNALLSGSTDRVMEMAEERFDDGYRTFKLKVDAATAAVAVESVTALHERFGKDVSLRLDANQSFGFDEALAFARALPDGSVSFVEEPLREPERVGEFHAQSGVRVALDESLWLVPGLVERVPAGAVAALVLKPNCLGGIAASLRLVSLARANGWMAVFSSAFESGISLGFYASLAASTGMEPVACGLDTYRWLSHDLLPEPIGVEDGMLDHAALYLRGRTPDLSSMKRRSVWTI